MDDQTWQMEIFVSSNAQSQEDQVKEYVTKELHNMWTDIG
jgi:hypothetical protein